MIDAHGMKYLYTFLLRLVLSIILAYIISIFFFKGLHPLRTSLLAAVMLVLAYLFEYTKKRNRE